MRIRDWSSDVCSSDLGNTPVYNTKCATAFAFPADPPANRKAKIREEAEALDALRKRVMAVHADLTRTKLYNVVDALRDGRALPRLYLDVHERGRVTLIGQHHDTYRTSVGATYPPVVR